MTSANASRPPSIRFRGRSLMAFVLAPLPPIANWLAELDKWSRDSPGYFVDRPIILDLASVMLDTCGIGQLVEALGGRGIRIMGLEGVEADQLGPSLPPLLKGGVPRAAARRPRWPRPIRPMGRPRRGRRNARSRAHC